MKFWIKDWFASSGQQVPLPESDLEATVRDIGAADGARIGHRQHELEQLDEAAERYRKSFKKRR